MLKDATNVPGFISELRKRPQRQLERVEVIGHYEWRQGGAVALCHRMGDQSVLLSFLCLDFPIIETLTNPYPQSCCVDSDESTPHTSHAQRA